MCEHIDVVIAGINSSTVFLFPLLAGLAGSPFFQKWRHTWLSLDNDGESIQLYKRQPVESAKLPSVRASFFTSFLVFAKDRNDEEMSFSSWQADVDANRCFVMATPDNIYYLMAESEEDKK